MSRNLVTFALSPFHKDAKVQEYHGDGNFTASCIETTETGLKYIIAKLAEKGEKVDAVYVFVTETVRNNGDFEKFCKLFEGYDLSFTEVPLADNGQIESVMSSLNAMFDVVQPFLKSHSHDEICMHIDMTGGPRHVPMIMMSLLQILRYQGVQMGMVVYTDFQKNWVEDASQVLDLFNLVSGTAEFVAYGSTRQLQLYCEKQPQDSVSGEFYFLLHRMNQVSDTIRLCSNYEGMESALQNLADAIRRYERFIQNHKGEFSRDELFDKLLPQVKEEYKSILPTNEKINPADIITWCAKKGFLQQGMTFYTEWMPRYLVQAEFVTIQDHVIEEDCRSKGNIWSSWEIYFFKDYIPNEMVANQVDEDTAELTCKQFRNLMKSNDSLRKIADIVKGKNAYVDEFFANVHAASQANDLYKYLTHHHNLLYDIIYASKPDTIASFNVYLIKRIGNATFSELIKRAVGAVNNEALSDILHLPNVSHKVAIPIEEKGQVRANVFQWLFKNKKIKSTLPEKQVVQFAENYAFVVSKWRNNFNHANITDTSNEVNDEIKQLLIENVAFLTTQTS